MLITLFLALAVLAKGENIRIADSKMEYSEDNWASSDWLPETGNEISPVIDVDELGERFRKTVRLLKTDNEIELVFLIDSSSSIGEENFKSELKFVQKLLADFNVGPSSARVAVIGFASSATTYVNHFKEEMHEKCTFLHVQLPGIEYTGGNTNTIEALLTARRIFENSRYGARKALFLVTDGFSNKGDPIPTAKELKDDGIIIFSFGIQTGNVREVRQMSSTPTEDYSFILESFSEFEALARRALHEDLKSGTYMTLNNTALCDNLCLYPSSETGCCNSQSRCSCGILTGHFACLCPAGHYGSGLFGEECYPCPIGTYHDGSTPGDILVCTECPDVNHITVKTGATKEEECVCREGYASVDGRCEVATCPVLEVPTNGYFVKKNCSNVLNAACGIRCSTGYKLHGSSVRMCLGNGTWSGNAPTCVPKSCRKPKPVRDSTVSCKNEDHGLETRLRYDSRGNLLENSVSNIHPGNETSLIGSPETGEFKYTVDTVCTFKCLPGFTTIGSKTRTCLPILQWNGLSTACTVVNCPSLSLLKDGFIKPDSCTEDGLRHDFATECSVSCREGYRLEGPSLRNCTGRRGTWTGKNVPNKCIDIEPPVFQCPENITVEATEEESYALVHLSLPVGTDNSGMEPIIWSKPPFLPEYPLPLKIGRTKIEVYGTDAMDNGDSCEFYVEVQDSEPPKIYNCESPPTFYLSDLNASNLELNWTEPIFTDNSETPLKLEKSHDFGNFSVGTTSVLYIVTDSSGNSANCTINITVAENPCSDRPNLGNVEWNCTTESNKMNCSLACPVGRTWTTSNDLNDVTFMCQYDRTGARWHPDVFSDLDAFPECSEFEIPTEVVESHEIELDEVLCEDLDSLREEISNKINILVGTDDDTKISVIADCIDEDAKNETSTEIESNDLPHRRKRNAGNKRVKIHVSFIGSSDNNKTSTEDVAKHLQKLGEKVDKEYTKNSFINIGGKRLKIQKAKVVNTARLRCNPGFSLKRRLCVKCPSGTFYDASKSNCIPCPIGQFQSLEGQLNCEPCPAGYLTRRRRRKQRKDCKKICSPGTFGKIKIKQQRLALAPCIPCPIGSYQPTEGQTSCMECPMEKTTTKKGSVSAEQCIDKLVLEDPCYEFKCQNNGTCFVYNGYPYCLCAEGYLGSWCEKERNHCDSFPCYNNAECIPLGVTSFRCLCPKGYEGDLCQFEINECGSNPCVNGAECIDLVNAYKCECLPGYTGDKCEDDIDECEAFNNPCQNNGICKDLINGYNCTCQDGYTGKHCEEISECEASDLVDKDCNVKMISVPKQVGPCVGIVCPDNMECTVAAGNRNLPLCTCRKGFYGRNCDDEINFNVILTFPKRSVTEYIGVNFPPEDIQQITVCLWIQTADIFNYGTLFSYAIRNDDNTFTITDYQGFVLYVKGQRVVTDVVANDGYWHFICITWESEGGRWEIYLDGKMRGNGRGLSTNAAIPGGGRFIIGQEQDRFGGGFNEVESFVGKITHFDIWQRVLHKSEIEDMNENCKYFEGDLYSWVKFLNNIHGNIEISKSTFCTNCNVRELRLLRGQVSIKNSGDSTFGVYECDKGFRISLGDSDEEEMSGNNVNSWYRKCLKHGNWEPTVPSCKRISCGLPGHFPHGVILGDSYLYHDIIEYQCNAGYSLVGNSKRECLENGIWSGSQPICKGSVGFCEEIVAPRHGSMFINFASQRKSYSSSLGDRAEFICDEGYRLRGSNFLTCSEAGLWDGEVPTCEEVSCTFPGELRDYVNSTFSETYAAGETLLVRCRDSENTEIIQCLENGRWNHSSGLCGSRCESRPNYPEFGLLLGDPLKYVYEPGETVSAKCRYGYKLNGDDFFTCFGDGTWYQAKKMECEPVQCAKPFPPTNSYDASTVDVYPYGRRILFRCLPGYRQLGDLLTRCDGEGNWTKIFGRCVGVFCRIPNTSYDIKIIDGLYTYGDVMKFECLQGKTARSKNIFCQADGTWSEMPSCI